MAAKLNFSTQKESSVTFAHSTNISLTISLTLVFFDLATEAMTGVFAQELKFTVVIDTLPTLG